MPPPGLLVCRSRFIFPIRLGQASFDHSLGFPTGRIEHLPTTAPFRITQEHSLHINQHFDAGVNVLALARMLGHKDASVTLRVYADLFDADLDAVAVTLHARYSPDIARIARIARKGSGKESVLKMCSPGARDTR